MEEKTFLEETWKKHGYPSAYKLYLILKKRNPEIKLASVDEFVSAQKAHQLHKKTRHSVQGHIVAYCKDGLWFADLLDMSNYSRQNKGYRWILLCVDTFTRKAYAEALKRKTKVAVKEGFEAIMDRLGTVEVQLLITDSGSEFLNQPVQNLLRELKIEHRTVEVGDHFALGIIDRLSRTIKEMIFQDFTERGGVQWYGRLQQFIDAYNSNPHRGIDNLTPEEAASGVHDETLLQLNVEKTEIPESKFVVGDNVRRRLKRPTWKKGYKQIWTERVYEIVEIDGVRAKLKGGDDLVRLNDLQRVPSESPSDETDAVGLADCAHKVEQTLKHKEGVDPANILETRLRARRDGGS